MKFTGMFTTVSEYFYHYFCYFQSADCGAGTPKYMEDLKLFDKQGVGESLKQHLPPKCMAFIVCPAHLSLMSSMWSFITRR